MRKLALLSAFAVAACASSPPLDPPLNADVVGDEAYCEARATGSVTRTGDGLIGIASYHTQLDANRRACLMERGWRVKH